MLRGHDVPTMMLRVETALNKQSRTRGRANPLIIEGQGEDEFGIGALRSPAVLVTEFQADSARPVLGRIIRFIKKLVRRALRWYMVPITEQQSRFNLANLDIAERMRASHEKLATDLASIRIELKEGLSKLDTRLDNVAPDLRATSKSSSDEVEGHSDMSASSRAALDYRGFEDRHRGSFENTKKLLEPYVAHFRSSRRVLDIGCGRGEFLQLLKENSISGYGVDLDQGMVDAAIERGLEVVVGDAIEHLFQLPAQAIDGVFSSQVAEHLQTSQLVTMIELCYRRLDAGGVCVIETPNPESLFIFHSFFYVDLTHIKPIHPEALRWAMESVGFTNVRIDKIQPVPPGTRLQDLPPELVSEVGWDIAQQNTARLNSLIYGPQHYAAIGFKPGGSHN